MTYASTVTVTVDTICPWTYLARRRLSHALAEFRAAHPDAPATFTVRYAPYQLYPAAPAAGEDKRAWYAREKYADNEDTLRKYELVMGALGRDEGIDFRFGGTIANTLPAHSLVQWAQATYGPEVAEKVVESLYSQYFEHEAHPSADGTLLEAAAAAGIPDADAAAFAQDDEDGWHAQTALLVREQASNGVDAVPLVVVEGRRRDMSLVGAKEVREYVRALEQVMKECS